MTNVDTDKERAMAAAATANAEIVFEVRGTRRTEGIPPARFGYGIHTQGDDWPEIRRNVREAVDCCFGETMAKPRINRLHFVRQKALLA